MRKNVSSIFVIAALALTASAQANLLVDSGFESNPLTTASNVLNNFVTYQGQWGVEAATITGVDAGIVPPEGVKMLRMTDDGLTATQAFQATDVTSYAVAIDSNSATVSFAALFNAGSNVPAAGAGVAVSFFSAANYPSLISSAFGNLTLDNNPTTWQSVGLNVPVPAGTRWLVSQVIYTNSTMLGNPGYVDAARLTVVPEPATLAMLALGGLGLIRRRRGW